MTLDHPKCKAYGLNERVFTLDYAEWVCAREKIVLRYEPTLWSGLYFVRRNRPTIIINPLASAAEQLLALLHELGHHFRHSPKTCFYQPKYLDKTEYEAEEFAAYAAMPYYLITSKLPWEIQEEFGYSTEILDFRKELFEQFKV